MQTLLALISALTTAIYFVYVSQVMKKHPGLSSTITLAAGHVIAAATLLPVWLLGSYSGIAQVVMPSSLSLLIVTAALLVISRELYFYAYAHTDVANITVFSALTPVYTLGTGFLVLHEVPAPLSVIGLLLICISIYGMFLTHRKGMSLASTALHPFVHIGRSRPILCAFLSTIPTAFAATFQKKLLFSLDPVTFSLFLLLTIGLFAFAVSLWLFRPGELLRQFKTLPPAFILASAALLPLMHVLFCFVMQHQQTAVSLVLQRCSIVFQILLAYYFLHEERYFRKRFVAALVIMAGFVLVISGS